MDKLHLTGAAKPAKNDVLEIIQAIDNELVEWILHAAPSSDDEKEQMKQVLALRTKLNQHANQLVLARMKLSTSGVEHHCVRLGVVTEQIRGTTKSIVTVKEVLGVADEAVTIAAQVVAFVAG